MNSSVAKRVLAALAVMALMVIAPTGASATDVDKVNRAVVWVDVQYKGTVTVPFQDNTTGTYPADEVFYCTGFFVSKDADVATAGHCLEKNNSSVRLALIRDVIEDEKLNVKANVEDLDWNVTINEPTVFIGQPNIANGGPLSGRESLLARVVAFQPFENGDSAVLKISNMTVTDYLTIASENPKVQDEVTSVGFPVSVDRVTDVTRQAATFTTGTVSSQSTTKKGVPVTQINAAVSKGMSGGPTLNAKDEVVGVNSFLITGESQPFNFVNDTEILREFLAANGVEMATATTPSTTASPVPNSAGPAQVAEKSSSMPAWVYVVIGLLVLLVAGLAVLVMRKPKAHRQVVNTDGPPEYMV